MPAWTPRSTVRWGTASEVSESGATGAQEQKGSAGSGVKDQLEVRQGSGEPGTSRITRNTTLLSACRDPEGWLVHVQGGSSPFIQPKPQFVRQPDSAWLGDSTSWDLVE
jgi:hypothetical protein